MRRRGGARRRQMTTQRHIEDLMLKHGVDTFKGVASRILHLESDMKQRKEFDRQQLIDMKEEMEDFREVLTYEEDKFKLRIETLQGHVRAVGIEHGHIEGMKEKSILAMVQVNLDIKHKEEDKRSAMKVQEQLMEWYTAFRKDYKRSGKYLKQDLHEDLLAAAREFQAQLRKEAEVFYSRLYKNYELIISLVKEIEYLHRQAAQHKEDADYRHENNAKHTEHLKKLYDLLREANGGLHQVQEVRDVLESVIDWIDDDLGEES